MIARLIFSPMMTTVATLISPDEVPSLQLMLIGGEMLKPEVRDKWVEAVTFMNMCVLCQSYDLSPNNL